MPVELERVFWLLVVSCVCLALFLCALRIRMKRLEAWIRSLDGKLAEHLSLDDRYEESVQNMEESNETEGRMT